MNFDFSEEQQLTRDMVSRFLGPIDVQARQALRRSPARYSRERWQQLADLGLLAMAAPPRMGGMGSSMVDLVLVAEALGQGLAIDPWLENAIFPIRLASAIGDEALVGALISGEAFVAVAFAEEGAGYGLTAKQVRADGLQISGQKSFVCGANLADHLLVTVSGDNLATISGTASGVERQDYPIIDGSLAATLCFQRAPATLAPLSAEALAHAAADAQLIAAGEMLGLAQMMFDHTLDYVRDRKQFGVPIGSFQALQHRLAHCYGWLEQMRSMLLRTAMLQDSGPHPDWPRQTAGAKAFISEGAVHVGREAVQMHGGMGQSDELAITHAFKRVLMLDKYLGDQLHCLQNYARAA